MTHICARFWSPLQPDLTWLGPYPCWAPEWNEEGTRATPLLIVLIFLRLLIANFSIVLKLYLSISSFIYSHIYITYSCIYSFIYLFTVYLFIHLYIHSIIYFIYLLIYLFVWSLRVRKGTCKTTSILIMYRLSLKNDNQTFSINNFRNCELNWICLRIIKM